jgi:hypothetical protein
MLAQWLVRFNPAEWKRKEAAGAGRLVMFYAAGLAVGVTVAWALSQVLGAGTAFLPFTAGWLIWSGIVAIATWRYVRRIDRTPPDVTAAAYRPRGGDGDDEIAFYHHLSNGMRIPYRRNPDFDREKFREIANDILIPETPEWGFPREAPRHDH